MRVTATEAKNRFGYYLSQSEREPVHVLKNERVAGVIVSAARYAELLALEQKKTLAQRKREFDETYKAWISEQNAHHQAHGLWCEGLVAWQEQS
ncbi:prevent-host-death protein [Melaminivora suipulveris]|uniref:Prevent-host-death protein n=1 Tax=Melaminivora suipulveris TaxID=2109913 RepID=A0A2R3QE57_9BURK|nr:type II toxin-antitoxin system prevent-host-death family antitoxin [Melaminivora suipulveris]AVO50076.1 prevent-host-death protein [Melaminivora suipulveris]